MSKQTHFQDMWGYAGKRQGNAGKMRWYNPSPIFLPKYRSTQKLNGMERLDNYEYIPFRLAVASGKTSYMHSEIEMASQVWLANWTKAGEI